ncbi:PAS domain S-box protein, partial [Thermodesulfobacteriota bacterium]
GDEFPGDTHPSMVALRTGEGLRNAVMGVFNPQTENYTWININAVPLFRPGEDRPNHVYTTFEDITERKQAEAILRESEEKYRDLVENINDVVYSVDLEGRITYVNPRLEDMMGYTPSEVIGKPFTELIHPDDISFARKRFRVLLDGRIEADEYRLLDKKGEARWARASIRPMVKDGEVVGLQGVLVDITDTRQAQEELAQSEARYRSLFANMIEGVAVYRAVGDAEDFVFVDRNKAAEKITGMTKSEVLGKSVFEIFPSLKKLGLVDVFRRVWRTGKPERVPTGLYEDRRISAWLTSSIYALPSGEIVALYSDETSRHMAEQALRESEEKFRLLSEQNLLGIIIIQDGLVKYVNRAAAEVTEYSIEEALGWKPNEFGKLFHPDDLGFVMEQAQKKQDGSQDVVTHYSYRMITKSGEVKWIDQYSKTIPFEGGSDKHHRHHIEEGV